MIKLSVAAGKTVAYLTQRIRTCKMAKKHCHKLGPAPKTFCVTLCPMFYDQFLKINARNLTKYLTEQTRNL